MALDITKPVVCNDPRISNIRLMNCCGEIVALFEASYAPGVGGAAPVSPDGRLDYHYTLNGEQVFIRNAPQKMKVRVAPVKNPTTGVLTVWAAYEKSNPELFERLASMPGMVELEMEVPE